AAKGVVKLLVEVLRQPHQDEVLNDNLCESRIGHAFTSFSTGLSVVNLVYNVFPNYLYKIDILLIEHTSHDLSSRESELINTRSFPRKTFVDDRSKGSPSLIHVISKQIRNRFQSSFVAK
ncbi:hypothetical protein Tco_1572994, partial [Tanacetum coccineum]